MMCVDTCRMIVNTWYHILVINQPRMFGIARERSTREWSIRGGVWVGNSTENELLAQKN